MGRFTDCNSTQPSNPLTPILTKLVGKQIVVKLVHEAKALSPIFVIVPGAVTVLREAHCANASSPTLTTGAPAITLGMTTSLVGKRQPEHPIGATAGA